MIEYKKDYFEDRKLKYEKNHGAFIHAFMFTEFSNRILGQCNVALNDLQRQLDFEIARAKAEEKRLDEKIDTETNRAKAEEVRLDGKIDTEINRATGRENELSTSINACLPKAGGVMNDDGLITWAHEPNNRDAKTFTMGGLMWQGATDYVSIKGVITGQDNMNLIFNMGDDDSNSISFTNSKYKEVASIQSNGVYTGTIDWDHINNRPENDNINPDLNKLREDIDNEISRAQGAEYNLDNKITTIYSDVRDNIYPDLDKIKNNINKVLKYSNLYYSNDYDINEIDDNNKINYPLIMLNGDGRYVTSMTDGRALNDILNVSFSVIATALNEIKTRLDVLENK